MLSNNFKINEVDKYAYVKNTDESYVIVCLYIDDILILGSNDYMIKSTKKILTNMFHMKDLGIADAILRIKCFRKSNGLVLSQSYYIEKILDKFFNGENNIIKTPIDISVYLFKN